MTGNSPTPFVNLTEYLRAQQEKGMLRLMTCGSVDDGKSTLLGRLLFDSKRLFSDQLAALEMESRKRGLPEGGLDFSLLLDGLMAEREQGITIDVAYRYFSTEKRKFIVADSPGHEQYTRNMVTAASNSELAIVLVDARKGVVQQTRRHTYLLSLLGIQKVILAVNKMDTVDYSEHVYRTITEEYLAFVNRLGINTDWVLSLPLSAVLGDNVTMPSSRTPYYVGPSLLETLESIEIAEKCAKAAAPLRVPVQWVNRPHQDFRGFCGMIQSGAVQCGDQVMVVPSKKGSKVVEIWTGDQRITTAYAGQSVTIRLADELDISRGDVLVSQTLLPHVSDQFQTTIVWMDEEPLLPGRSYLCKLGAQTGTAVVTLLKHKVNVNTLESLAARKLELNEIGLCNVKMDRAVVFDSYAELRNTGSCILIDRMNNRTVGAGLLHFPLWRADNLHWQQLEINQEARARQKDQTPRVLWFTGLSGAGKSTIANLVDKKLYALGRHVYVLDGDNVRHGLCKDLGFAPADRVENIRRVAEVAKLLVDAGLVVLVAFISPFRAERQFARSLFPEGTFLEVFIDTPLAEAERRDPKGLYEKARLKQVRNFTGIDSPYEPPQHPELRIDTTAVSAETAAQQIVDLLEGVSRPTVLQT